MFDDSPSIAPWIQYLINWQLCGMWWSAPQWVVGCVQVHINRCPINRCLQLGHSSCCLMPARWLNLISSAARQVHTGLQLTAAVRSPFNVQVSCGRRQWELGETSREVGVAHGTGTSGMDRKFSCHSSPIGWLNLCNDPSLQPSVHSWGPVCRLAEFRSDIRHSTVGHGCILFT